MLRNEMNAIFKHSDNSLPWINAPRKTTRIDELAVVASRSNGYLTRFL